MSEVQHTPKYDTRFKFGRDLRESLLCFLRAVVKNINSQYTKIASKEKFLSSTVRLDNLELVPWFSARKRILLELLYCTILLKSELYCSRME